MTPTHADLVSTLTKQSIDEPERHMLLELCKVLDEADAAQLSSLIKTKPEVLTFLIHNLHEKLSMSAQEQIDTWNTCIQNEIDFLNTLDDA